MASDVDIGHASEAGAFYLLYAAWKIAPVVARRCISHPADPTSASVAQNGRGRRFALANKAVASLNANRNAMNAIRISALVLIVAGVLGLLYGGFSYTKETHDVKLGPIELSVQEKQTVNVPIWAGVGAIVLGGVLLVVGGKKG